MKDGETVTVENKKGVGFVNEPIPVPEVPSSPKTGDISNPLVFIIIGLSALFVSAASLIILKKKFQAQNLIGIIELCMDHCCFAMNIVF